MAPRIDEIPV
uniref:Uncharacterized protein n=1 Tax=Anguilla anguilla TaxID=7936 RepID=A0A0E9VYQ8_ANGAN